MNEPHVTDLEILTDAECLRLLRRGVVGRVAFLAGGRLRLLPVNYAADEDGLVVFRTTATSSLTAIDAHPVTFEVDGYDERHRTGWSVTVEGTGRALRDADDPATAHLRELNVRTWAPGPRDSWYVVIPDLIEGRRLPLVATPADFGWLPGVVS